MNKPSDTGGAARGDLRALSRGGDAYRFLFSEAELAVFLVAEEIEDCNDAACRLLGRARGEIVGRSPLEFAPAMQSDGSPSEAGARRRLESALAGLPQWCEWQWVRGDGTVVDSLGSVEAIRVDGVRRILLRVRDVSALQRAEVALKETEARLQQMLDNTSTAVVFAKDLTGRYLFANRAFERIVGRPQGDIVGRTTHELFPPETAAALRANDQRVILSRSKIEVEEEVKVAGETRWLLSNKFPLIGADGEPYAVCGISADITDRKRSEEALRRAALAVSGAGGERGLQGLVGALADILGVDVALVSVFTDANHTQMRTLAAVLEGKQLRSYDYAIADSPCAGLIGRDFRFVESGARHEIPAGTMFHAKGMDSYAAYALTDVEGAPVGLIAVMNRAPMQDAERVEAMLKIFAVRAGAEIERIRAEEALRSAALAVSGAVGDEVFGELVRALATILDVEIAFIALPLSEDPRRLRMLAFYLDGRMVAEFEYAMAGTPCETVFGQGYQIYPDRLTELFPLDRQFIDIGVRSYAGLPLFDAHGAPIGIVSVVSRKPLGHPERVEAMLKIFAARAVTEIERMRADEALRAAEASYRAIFEAAEDPIFVHDWDTGAVVDVNSRACEVYGYSADELKRLTIDEISSGVRPYTAEDAARWLDRAKAEGAVQFEWHRKNRDGSLHWDEVRLKSAVIGGRRRVLAFVREITERKLAEEQLRASEAQYRAIFNGSEDALVLWNSSLRRVDINPAYERVYGYTRDEVFAESYPGRVPSEYAEQRRELVRRTLAGEACQAELESLRKDGTRIQVEVRTIPIQHRGEPHVLAISRDVTERKRAEAAVRASEEQYRTIFNASVDGMLLWDGEHRIVDVNEAFLAMHGYTRDELIGETRPVFIPHKLQAECEVLLPAILGGEPCHLEARSQRKDGSEFDVEIHGIPMQYRGEPHVLVILRDVTARREAEERLRASEERYRLLFEMESDAILLVDAATLRLIDANRAAEGLWGYDRAALLARTVADLSAEPDESRASIQSPTGRVHIPLRMHRKRDGTVFPVEITANRLMLDGRLTVVAAVRDITERQAREEALVRSEEQYRAIFNASLDGMIIRTPDGEIADVNPALLAMYGYSREELVGKNPSPIISHENDASFRVFLAAVRAGQPHRVESRARRKDGSEFYVDAFGSPVTYQGRPHVLSVVRDVTERKAGEARIRATVEAALESIIIMDERGDITEFNPAAERCFGLRRADVLGRPLADVLIPERFREGHRRGLARYLETGSGPFIGKRVEVTAQRGDGTEFPAELAIAVARASHGRIFVGYLRDITERRRAEEERGRLEAQLRQAQKMEAIGHLTGGIAHDFNNILTSILGYIVLGEERQSDLGDAKLGRYLEQARLASQRARDLIQQMLTFSRGQRGERRALALDPLVKDSVKLLRSTLPATIELETEIAHDVPPVVLDPVQLEQVLLNLCINARDAMGGAGQLKVSVALCDTAEATCASCRQQVAGRFVEIAVHDTGPGIAPDVLERIFEPFFTTKEVGRGSGMGLAMVHGIVHDHGGHIVVDTAPGKGTVFRLRFAAADAASVTTHRVARDGGAASRRPQLSGRVLLVDDERMVSEFMAELLGNWGLDVFVKRNPVEAEAWFEHHPDAVDLVITDQTMPKLTGLELAGRISTLRPDVPVVLYTGYSDNITDEDLARCGVRSLLRKPVEPEALLAVLRANLPGGAAQLAPQVVAPAAAPREPAARSKRGRAPSAPRTRVATARKPASRRR